MVPTLTMPMTLIRNPHNAFHHCHSSDPDQSPKEHHLNQPQFLHLAKGNATGAPPCLPPEGRPTKAIPLSRHPV